jgi:hypothetical protein
MFDIWHPAHAGRASAAAGRRIYVAFEPQVPKRLARGSFAEYSKEPVPALSGHRHDDRKATTAFH